MFDAPDQPSPIEAPIATGPDDLVELVHVGIAPDHLGRLRRCAWHLVLHRGGSGPWTHLYRVQAEPGGGVLVLLDHARPGDQRHALRILAGAAPSGPRRLLRG